VYILICIHIPVFVFKKILIFTLMVAVALLDQQCVNRIATGAAVGGALGASIGT
jgi:hypothetical protein